MRLLKHLVSLAIITGSLQNVFGFKMWDIALLDISSDMDAYAKNDINEMHIADTCIRSIISDGMTDSVMFFAGGRAILPAGDISEGNRDYSDWRRITGNGTSTYDAVASCLQLSHNAGRIIVVTNGREGESSISSATLSKLMKSKGVIVDAIVVSASCDSIYVKPWYSSTDSILSERNHINPGLKNIVNRTGGKIITIEGNNDISKAINELGAAIANKKNNPSKMDCDLNKDLTEKVLARLTPQKLYICEADTTAVITFNGNKYHGLHDIINTANSNPYILINRTLTSDSDVNQPLNIVFVSNQDELERKQSIINKIVSGDFDSRLSQATPIDALPMIYYSGAGGKMLLCGLEFGLPEE